MAFDTSQPLELRRRQTFSSHEVRLVETNLPAHFAFHPELLQTYHEDVVGEGGDEYDVLFSVREAAENILAYSKRKDRLAEMVKRNAPDAKLEPLALDSKLVHGPAEIRMEKNRHADAAQMRSRGRTYRHVRPEESASRDAHDKVRIVPRSDVKVRPKLAFGSTPIGCRFPSQHDKEKSDEVLEYERRLQEKVAAVSPEERAAKGPSLEHLLETNARHIRRRAQWQETHEREKREQEAELSLDCTFSPELTKVAMQRSRTVEDLYRWHRRKEAKIEQLRKAGLEAEQAELDSFRKERERQARLFEAREARRRKMEQRRAAEASGSWGVGAARRRESIKPGLDMGFGGAVGVGGGAGAAPPPPPPPPAAEASGSARRGAPLSISLDDETPTKSSPLRAQLSPQAASQGRARMGTSPSPPLVREAWTPMEPPVSPSRKVAPPTITPLTHSSAPKLKAMQTAQPVVFEPLLSAWISQPMSYH